MPPAGYSKFSPAELEQLSRLYSQMTLRQIADLMGKTYNSVHHQARRLGLTKLLADSLVLHPVTATSEQVAYTAGLIDGDGTVSIRHMAGKHNPKPHFRISSTYWPLMEWLRHTYSGPSVFVERATLRPPRLQCYGFHVGGLSHLPLYQALLPYMVIKARRMECLIEFCQERLTQGRFDPLSQRCQQMVDTVYGLNTNPSLRYPVGPCVPSRSAT
jgi:hypothetical protein